MLVDILIAANRSEDEDNVFIDPFCDLRLFM